MCVFDAATVWVGECGVLAPLPHEVHAVHLHNDGVGADVLHPLRERVELASLAVDLEERGRAVLQPDRREERGPVQALIGLARARRKLAARAAPSLTVFARSCAPFLRRGGESEERTMRSTEKQSRSKGGVAKMRMRGARGRSKVERGHWWSVDSRSVDAC